VDDEFPHAMTPVSPSKATTSNRGGAPKPEPFRWRYPHRETLHHHPLDVASVLGMPLGGIPKPVQEAVSHLVEEVERLRGDLDHALGHALWLEEINDLHPLLPVLNRRSFMRHLGHVMDQSLQAGLPGALLFLHVGGLEPLRAVHGLAAGEAALLDITETLKAELRQTDLLSYLDSGDFVIALALAEEEGAGDKAKRIAGSLEQKPFLWQERRFQFTVTWGLARFRPSDTAETVLAEADAARRGA